VSFEVLGSRALPAPGGGSCLRGGNQEEVSRVGVKGGGVVGGGEKGGRRSGGRLR